MARTISEVTFLVPVIILENKWTGFSVKLRLNNCRCKDEDKVNARIRLNFRISDQKGRPLDPESFRPTRSVLSTFVVYQPGEFPFEITSSTKINSLFRQQCSASIVTSVLSFLFSLLRPQTLYQRCPSTLAKNQMKLNRDVEQRTDRDRFKRSREKRSTTKFPSEASVVRGSIYLTQWRQPVTSKSNLTAH